MDELCQEGVMPTVCEQSFSKRGRCVVGPEDVPHEAYGWAPTQKVSSARLTIAAQWAGLIGGRLLKLW